MNGQWQAEWAGVADRFGVDLEQVRRDHLISHVLAAVSAMSPAQTSSLRRHRTVSNTPDRVPSQRGSRPDRGGTSTTGGGQGQPTSRPDRRRSDQCPTATRRGLGLQLAERGLITPEAVAVFVARGPFGEPPGEWVFTAGIDERDWRAALGHQTRLSIRADHALSVVGNAWLTAAGGTVRA